MRVPWTARKSNQSILKEISPEYSCEKKIEGTRPDRVPDELWTEVCDTVQETGIKTIPVEKKCKKAKWLSEAALHIAVKRREAKKSKEKRKDISI